jgi:phage baseplate assembly protein W
MGGYHDEYEWKSSGTSTGTLAGTEFVSGSAPIGVVIPLEEGTGLDGLFAMTYDGVQQLALNLQNLISTNHGERTGKPEYGANLRPLCAEYSTLSLSEFESEAMRRIQKAVREHLSLVELDDFTTSYVQDDDPALLRIDMNIKFNVPQLASMGNKITVSFALL